MQNVERMGLLERAVTVAFVTGGLVIISCVFIDVTSSRLIWPLIGVVQIAVVFLGLHKKALTYLTQYNKPGYFTLIAILLSSVSFLGFGLYAVLISVALALGATLGVVFIITVVTAFIAFLANVIVLIVNLIELVRYRRKT